MSYSTSRSVKIATYRMYRELYGSQFRSCDLICDCCLDSLPDKLIDRVLAFVVKRFGALPLVS